MKIHILPIFMIILSSCRLLISQQIPDDVVVRDDKYVAVGLGSAIKELYNWPNDEYHKQLFNQWWRNTKRMGTNSIMPYTVSQYRLYFSRELYIAFDHEDFGYIMFTYSGNKLHGDMRFIREVRSSDRKLLEECIKITKTSSKINNEPTDERYAPCWND